MSAFDCRLVLAGKGELWRGGSFQVVGLLGEGDCLKVLFIALKTERNLPCIGSVVFSGKYPVVPNY